jgi:lipopolysaccharide transport system ATP-binding protein
MEEVSKGGRTVLVVSHNLAMIERICQRALLLQNGTIAKQGNASSVVESYAEADANLAKVPLADRMDRNGAGEIVVHALELLDGSGNSIGSGISGRETIFRLHYESKVDKVFKKCRVSISVHGRDGRPYFVLSTDLVDATQLDLYGNGYIDFIVPELPLSEGTYYLASYIDSNKEIQDWIQNAVPMKVNDGDFYGTGKNYPPGWQGASVLVRHRWRVGAYCSASSQEN